MMTDEMDDTAFPIELALSIGIACGGCALFLLWRLVVALRSGIIWLRGQTVSKSDEPLWFAAYALSYIGMIGVMLYGVGVALAR
jgi:hypothetical protein